MGKTGSYYEELCKRKTPLYPNGVKLTLMQRYAREAEKADATKRKKAARELGIR